MFRRLTQHYPSSLRNGPWLSVAAAGLLFAFGLSASQMVRAEDMPTFNLVAKAGYFKPETIEVPANTKFRLVVKNEGPEAVEFEMTNPMKEKVLAPGTERSLVFQPLPPGTYPFFGEFHLQTAKGRIIAK